MHITMATGMLRARVKTFVTKGKSGENFMAKFTVDSYDDYVTKAGVPGTSKMPFDCVAWNKLAQKIEHWAEGSIVSVTGKMQLRPHQKGDRTEWKTELMVEKAKLVLGESEPQPSQAEQPMPDYENQSQAGDKWAEKEDL